jgi:hypothetical protein
MLLPDEGSLAWLLPFDGGNRDWVFFWYAILLTTDFVLLQYLGNPKVRRELSLPRRRL